MTKVNNKKVIRRLAFRELKANRKMNFMVILSIVLTCILFTALTSIGGNLLNGFQQETMRQVGGDRMAGLKYVLPEDYEKVKSDKAVRDAVYRIIVGQAVNEDFRNISVEINCAGDKAAAESMFCMPNTGRLPEEYNEIAVSTLVLDELKLPYELGITVPITLDVDGDISEHEFTLCGYWKGEKVAMAQECWVSGAFADEYAPTPTVSFYSLDFPEYAGYWSVDFNYANSWDIEGKTSKLITRLYGNAEFIPDTGINWAYTTSNVDTEMLIGGIVIIFVIFAAGYLIIYNIFHINISANIRSYGLLKTIGTTSKQIKHMVRVQAAIYSAIGIPLGLIIGVLLGKVLLKSVMSTLNILSVSSYSISAGLLMIVCIIAALLTFATVMISCHKPCKIAESVSPMEALRYNETNISTKKKNKKTSKITPLSIAKNNMARTRKKTLVVVLSLTLSMVLFNTLFTLINGLDMDKFISNMIVGDFIVRQEHFRYDGEEFNTITPDDLQYLSHIDGIQEVDAVYYDFEFGNLQLEGKPLEKAKRFYQTYSADDEYGELNSITENYLNSDVYGVTPTIINKFEPIQGTIDTEKFSTGNYAIVYTQYIPLGENYPDDDFFSVGDTVELKGENGKSKSFEVMAVCEMPYTLSTQMYSMLYASIIISENDYFELYDNRNAMTVMINAEESHFDNVDTQIRYMTDSNNSKVVLKSRQTYADEYADFLKMIKLVGGTLSGILALIGILNFVNAVVTSIISRKREFAMMSAVGMTGKQLKTMLTWEGIHYAVFTTICSLIVGTLLSYVVVNGIAGEMFFFTYHFTLLPILICVPILLLLSAVIPSISYRTICGDSIVNRLREN